MGRAGMHARQCTHRSTIRQCNPLRGPKEGCRRRGARSRSQGERLLTSREDARVVVQRASSRGLVDRRACFRTKATTELRSISRSTRRGRASRTLASWRRTSRWSRARGPRPRISRRAVAPSRRASSPATRTVAAGPSCARAASTTGRSRSTAFPSLLALGAALLRRRRALGRGIARK